MDVENGPVLRELMEAARRFNRQTLLRRNAFTNLGLRPYEWHFLGHLSHADQGEGVKPSDLAATLAVTPGNITQVITSLESRGLINRKTDAHDRRAIRVSLTASGREHMEAMRASFTESYTGLVEAMGRDECLKLVSLLNQACDYLESRVPSSPENSPEGQQ